MRRVSLHTPGVLIVASSTIVVAATVAALGCWRFRLRTHPRWSTNDDARFYISAGSWSVLIALYWYLQARLDPAWVWDAWPVLATGSLVLLIRGVNALAVDPDQFVDVPPPPHSDHRVLTHRSPR